MLNAKFVLHNYLVFRQMLNSNTEVIVNENNWGIRVLRGNSSFFNDSSYYLLSYASWAFLRMSG
jgi:hypothetical protein